MVVACAHHRPAVDGRGGEGLLVGGDVAVIGVVTVELTAAIAHCIGGVLDGEPVAVVLATVTLVPVEAVVTTEGHEGVGDGDSTSEELDSVVQVGDNLHVVDGRTGADTTEGDAVDLVGRSQLGTAMADGDIGEDTGVVGIVATTVDGLVIVCGNALDLGGASKVGGGVTEDDEATPLTAGVVGDGTVERIGLIGHDDGRGCRSIGEDLTAFGYNQGCSVRTTAGSTLDHGAGFNGESLSRTHKDVAVQDVRVIGCPGGGSGIPGDLNRALCHGSNCGGEHDQQGENGSHGLVKMLAKWNNPLQSCPLGFASPLKTLYPFVKHVAPFSGFVLSQPVPRWVIMHLKVNAM